MGIKQNIRTVTWMRSHAAQMLNQINRTRSPVIITKNGEVRAVIQDMESYEKTRAALPMMKLLAQGERDIQAGKFVDHRKLFAKLRKCPKAPKHS